MIKKNIIPYYAFTKTHLRGSFHLLTFIISLLFLPIYLIFFKKHKNSKKIPTIIILTAQIFLYGNSAFYHLMPYDFKRQMVDHFCIFLFIFAVQCSVIFKVLIINHVENKEENKSNFLESVENNLGCKENKLDSVENKFENKSKLDGGENKIENKLQSVENKLENKENNIENNLYFKGNSNKRLFTALATTFTFLLIGLLKLIFQKKINEKLDVSLYILHGISSSFIINVHKKVKRFFVMGGIFYILGAILFEREFPNFNVYFGYHEIFHLFTITANFLFLFPVMVY